MINKKLIIEIEPSFLKVFFKTDTEYVENDEIFMHEQQLEYYINCMNNNFKFHLDKNYVNIFKNINNYKVICELYNKRLDEVIINLGWEIIEPNELIINRFSTTYIYNLVYYDNEDFYYDEISNKI